MAPTLTSIETLANVLGRTPSELLTAAESVLPQRPQDDAESASAVPRTHHSARWPVGPASTGRSPYRHG